MKANVCFLLSQGMVFHTQLFPFFPVALKPLLSGETLEFTFMNKSKSKFRPWLKMLFNPKVILL